MLRWDHDRLPFNQFHCIQLRSCLKLSESFNFLTMLRNPSCASGSVNFSLVSLDISVSIHRPVRRLVFEKNVQRIILEPAKYVNTTRGPDFYRACPLACHTLSTLSLQQIFYKWGWTTQQWPQTDLWWRKMTGTKNSVLLLHNLNWTLKTKWTETTNSLRLG